MNFIIVPLVGMVLYNWHCVSSLLGTGYRVREIAPPLRAVTAHRSLGCREPGYIPRPTTSRALDPPSAQAHPRVLWSVLNAPSILN
jgi:hypothetical protein